MRGLLFNDLGVELDPRTTELGGSFEGATAYAPEPLMWAYQYLSPRVGPVLVDVGACTGSYSLLAKHLASLTVYAFEPATPSFDVLCANIQLNDLEDRVFPQCLAVADYDGEGVFHVSDPTAMIALSQLGGTPAGNKHTHDETIRVVTLDSFGFDVPIDLIKIDVEGAELSVLQGAVDLINRDHPALLVEISEPNMEAFGTTPQAVRDLLSNWGYIVHAVGNVDVAAVYGESRT